MILSSQNSSKIHWTNHSKQKMRYYRFSESRVLRIFRKPDRVEEGIAPNTFAAMQKTGTRKHPTEAWTMYQIIKIRNPKFKNEQVPPAGEEQVPPAGEEQVPPAGEQKIKIISAWRYPGITPPGKRPSIPEDTLKELGLR